MTSRAPGLVFDDIATEYDRHRPRYPEELVARACAAADLAPGDPVLEVGCGTGQLTRALAQRGLKLTAVEPGGNLIALTARNVTGVEFVNARFEDALVQTAGYRAVFSASAFHWPDPSVSWARASGALVPEGTLALLSFCGVRDERTAPDHAAVMAALAAVDPELAAGWPPLRSREEVLAGVAARQGNVSDVWGWLMSRDLGRPEAASLFAPAEIHTVTVALEQTADELSALWGTLSFARRLGPDGMAALALGHRAVQRRLGRPIRSSLLAVLVTARRAHGRRAATI